MKGTRARNNKERSKTKGGGENKKNDKPHELIFITLGGYMEPTNHNRGQQGKFKPYKISTRIT